MGFKNFTQIINLIFTNAEFTSKHDMRYLRQCFSKLLNTSQRIEVNITPNLYELHFSSVYNICQSTMKEENISVYWTTVIL